MKEHIRGAVMMDTLLFYVGEMMAALILLTTLFVLFGGAILLLFLLDQVYKVVFDWFELRLRNLCHFASRIHQTYGPSDNQLVAVRRPVLVLTVLAKSAWVGNGLQLWRSSAVANVRSGRDRQRISLRQS